MSSFEQPEIHTKILELIKSDTIKLQDTSYWIAYGLMNRHSRLQSWQWLKDNWQWLKDVIGEDLSFSRTPIYAARNFSDDVLIADYEAFFSENMEKMIERAYSQGLEVAQTNAAWRRRDAKVALAWFTNKK